MTFEKVLLKILIKEVTKRMLVMVMKTSMSGGPSLALISFMISKPRYDEPKKTLMRIQLILDSVNLSLARREKVVRNPTQPLTPGHYKHRSNFTNIQYCNYNHKFDEVFRLYIQVRSGSWNSGNALPFLLGRGSIFISLGEIIDGHMNIPRSQNMDVSSRGSKF